MDGSQPKIEGGWPRWMEANPRWSPIGHRERRQPWTTPLCLSFVRGVEGGGDWRGGERKGLDLVSRRRVLLGVPPWATKTNKRLRPWVSTAPLSWLLVREPLPRALSLLFLSAPHILPPTPHCPPEIHLPLPPTTPPALTTLVPPPPTHLALPHFREGEGHMAHSRWGEEVLGVPWGPNHTTWDAGLEVTFIAVHNIYTTPLTTVQ
ncbi:unnamed protein product [Lepidochelys olivacea]